MKSNGIADSIRFYGIKFPHDSSLVRPHLISFLAIQIVALATLFN